MTLAGRALVAVLVLASVEARASSPAAAPSTDAVELEPKAESGDVYLQASAGLFGVIHRHPAPLTDPYYIKYSGLVPAFSIGARVSGVPASARTLEIGGEIRLHTALTTRLEVDGPDAHRPPGRTMGGAVSTGLTWWPRAIGHRFGVGAELGYTAAPFVIESDMGLQPYLLQGPIVRARLEGNFFDERLLAVVRPFGGVAFPLRLEAADITRPTWQLGLIIRTALRIRGPVYVFMDVQIWNAHLLRGQLRPFDDHELTGVYGLLFRTPRGRPRAPE